MSKHPFVVGDPIVACGLDNPQPGVAVVTRLTEYGFEYDYGRTMGGIPREGITYLGRGECLEAGLSYWRRATIAEIEKDQRERGCDMLTGVCSSSFDNQPWVYHPHPPTLIVHLDKWRHITIIDRDAKVVATFEGKPTPMRDPLPLET